MKERSRVTLGGQTPERKPRRSTSRDAPPDPALDREHPVTRSELPIGVFDSGIGGLTVLDALARLLPGEDLLYLGDTARVPYGSRSPETVERYTLRVAGHLVRRGVKCLVVACNTATTYGLDALRQATRPLGIPVVGVIQPGVQEALRETAGHVLVLGTEGTVRGGAYLRALHAQRDGLQVSQQACPLFVSLAEEGWLDGPVPTLVAQRYLGALAGLAEPPDTAILGCTHYPLLAGVVQAALPGVRLINSAAVTAQEVARMLDAQGLRRQAPGRATVRFLVTDNLQRFVTVGERFLGRPPVPAEVIDLSDADHGALDPRMASGA